MTSALLHERYQMQTPLDVNKPNVRKAWDCMGGRWVLVKSFTDSKQANLEFTALSRLEDAENIVRMLDTYTMKCFGGSVEWCLILEFVENGTLLDYLDRLGNEIPYSLFPRICKQLLNGLFQMHSRGVVHGDIKPSNILCKSDGNLIYCDFGLATVVDSGLEQIRLDKCSGTPAFVAPEILSIVCKHLFPNFSSPVRNYDGYAADIWSLGVTLYVLLTGDLPFDGPTQTDMFQKILHGRVSFPMKFGIPQPMQLLVKSMLRKDPKRRATITELLLNPILI